MKGSRQFRAELSELDQIFKWVREILSLYPQKKLEVAIEEAVVNVVSYAYPHDTSGVVEISYQISDHQFEFIIKDHGAPFNPLENPKPLNSDAPIEERDIGGLGIHLILKICDKATYNRISGWNVLTLIKLK